jgi:cytosine/adenosine deaminase-related metal-dependent hydrolase
MKTLPKSFLASLWILFACTSTAEIYAIRAGTTIDPATGSVVKNQTILVEDGVIKSIGTDRKVSSGAKVIDLSKEWVMPGLMDAHTHLTLTETTNAAPFESFYLTESTSYRALRGMKNAEALLNAGFTAIRDIGNMGDNAMTDVGRAVDKGLFTGPTIISSGKIIAPFGGQSHNIPAEQGAFWRYEYVDADGPNEIRKAVRQNIYYGARVIKLVLDNNPYHYTVEEVRTAVEEAHRAGIPVATHVYGGKALDVAIEAGVDSIEHGWLISDEQMIKMKDKGIFLVGTEFPQAHLDIIGDSGGIIPTPKILGPKIIERTRRAHELGLRMVFGSDVVMEAPNRSRADLTFDYLAVWRAGGVPPMGILKAMTSEAADLLRLPTQGKVAIGFAADLIATPADPLADIENLRKVDFVMKNGHLIRHGAIPTPAP